MKYWPQSNEIYAPVLHCIYLKFWRSFLKKRYKISSLITCCFASAFISAYIIFTIFQNVIQHYLQKDFRHKFYILIDSPKLHHLLSVQNLLDMRKFFCRCSLKFAKSLHTIQIQNLLIIAGELLVYKIIFPKIWLLLCYLVCRITMWSFCFSAEILCNLCLAPFL